MTTTKRPRQNKYNLPPHLIGLVSEKGGFPDDPVDVFFILCEEIEIQVSKARDHPEEDGRFPMIMHCALILEHVRKEVATKRNNECGGISGGSHV